MDPRSAAGIGCKSGATHAATGTVKNVDPKSEAVTLEHGAVPTLKWPANSVAAKTL